MKNVRRVAVPAYFAAIILVVFSALELTQAILPLRVGSVVWRVGAVGLFSRTLVTPVLGMLVAYCVALLLEQPRVLRTLSVVTATIALVLSVGVVLYALDVVQMRTQLTPEARSNYAMAMGLSFSKLALVLAFLVVLTRAQWRAATALLRGTASEKPASIILSQPARAAAVARHEVGSAPG